MSEERDDRLLDAALDGGPRRGQTPEERLETLRLRAAFLSLAAAADPMRPPAALKERLMAGIRTDARRRAWTRGLAMAASVLVAVGAAFFFKGSPSAQVAAISGDVLMNGKRLAAGDSVLAGSTLETPPGAWVNLNFGGRAVARLRDATGVSGGARLVLSRLRGQVELRLERGALFSHVRHGTPFSVLTPLAAASVRGTVFYVQVEPGRTYLCLCQGKLHVSSPAGDRDLETDHHLALRVGPSSLEDAPMVGHTDEEGAVLALP